MNVLATSGGFWPDVRRALRPGPLVDFAFELAGSPTRPRFCYLGTATGDSVTRVSAVYEAFTGRDVIVSHLALFPMPNVDDIGSHLLSQDVIWVGGGSVAGLLAMWRLHGLDEILREAWVAGVVLAGISAGSLCWHVGGTTDSFGPALRPVTDGLALVPYSNAVHYDSEEQRRPLYQRLVGDGTLPAGYATDDGVGLHYRGPELVDVVADTPGRSAYHVEPDGDGGAKETPIEPRLLGRSVARRPTARGEDDRRDRASSPGDVVTAINDAWLTGRPHDIAALVHRGMVIAGPDLRPVAVGREACVQSYQDFAARVDAVELTETGRCECVVGETAVVSYRYRISYDDGGRRQTDTGQDVFMLGRTTAGWQATWRGVLVDDEPE
jgi:peptidase E